VSVATFVVGKWDIAILFLAVLMLFGFLERFGHRAVLTLKKEGVEYKIGKVFQTAAWPEISNIVVKGNAFMGWRLRVEGNIFVAIGGNKPVKRKSIQVSDVFAEEIGQLREFLLASLRDNVKQI